MEQNRPDECEVCSNKDKVDAHLQLFMTMWMCPRCIAENKALSAKSTAEADIRVQQTRNTWDDTININRVIRQTSTASPITSKTDIFVAETKSIVSMADEIEANVEITDKSGELASRLLVNYQLYKEKIFANNAENMELANKQNAIQKYLNELKNKLTAEQREKFKLMDVNYKPNQVKMVANAQKAARDKPKKYDKAELNKAAERAGVPVSVIQMMCVAKHMTPMQASDKLLEAGSKKVEAN